MTNDEWYERERAAFIAWWESGGQEKFGATPTIAAGAAWFAKAAALHPEDMHIRNHMARIKVLETALIEIAKGEGPFSLDPLTHATNTIESMKLAANEALNRCEPQR